MGVSQRKKKGRSMGFHFYVEGGGGRWYFAGGEQGKERFK